MKLVLIQGTMLAQYEGRQQLQTIRLESWDYDYDMKMFVEEFRVNGVPDDVQAQHG